MATKWSPRQPFGVISCQSYVAVCEESDYGTPEAWFLTIFAKHRQTHARYTHAHRSRTKAIEFAQAGFPMLRGKCWKLIFNPENVESVSNLCRINVKLVSNSCPQNSFGHEMASQTAVWADNLSIHHSFLRGIRFWHSRGLVPDNFRRKSANQFFQKHIFFRKSVIQLLLHGEKEVPIASNLHGPLGHGAMGAISQ